MHQQNDTVKMNRAQTKFIFPQRKRRIRVSPFFVATCFLVPFLLPLFSSAQKIKRNEYDAAKKYWRVETVPVNVKSAPGIKMNVALSAAGTAYSLWLSGSGTGANTVIAGDALIFLLDDDSTVTVKSPSVQNFERGSNAYNHEYQITQDDLEILSRHDVRALRKYSTEGYNDVYVEKENATQLKEVSTAFLNELKKANVFLSKHPPGFPGGKSVLLGFLNRNVKPSLPLTGNERKYAVVQFTVAADGHVDDLQIKHSAGSAFDEELLRILKRMPKWKPATVNNKPVNATVTQPLTFLRTNNVVNIRF
jgi:TonB family protein